MFVDSLSPVRVGEVVAGKYRIERVLGAGGIGVVVQATHVRLNDRVVLKFLRAEMAKNAEMVTRFLREARAARRIKSEHVARVEDVDALPTGEPYIVMEHLVGSDLSGVIEREQRLPIDVAVAYLLEACEALAEAHAVGIVHRDLKPANLFLSEGARGERCIKVLDFGISKLNDVADSVGAVGLTGTHAAMGSPLYMSPEQVRSAKDVDARCDIWALGVILFELLCGETPFMGTTAPAVFAAVIADRPRSLCRMAPWVPTELEAVVLRCLEKEPSRRFSSVSALANALAPFAPRSKASIERISLYEPVMPVRPTVDENALTIPQRRSGEVDASFAPVASTLPRARMGSAPALDPLQMASSKSERVEPPVAINPVLLRTLTKSVWADSGGEKNSVDTGVAHPVRSKAVWIAGAIGILTLFVGTAGALRMSVGSRSQDALLPRPAASAQNPSPVPAASASLSAPSVAPASVLSSPMALPDAHPPAVTVAPVTLSPATTTAKKSSSRPAGGTVPSTAHGGLPEDR